MPRIKADISELKRNASVIEKQMSELDSMNRKLDALLASIEGSWEGAASDKYIAVMRNHKLKSEQMLKVLAEFKKYVLQAANNLDSQDKDGASRIRHS